MFGGKTESDATWGEEEEEEEASVGTFHEIGYFQTLFPCRPAFVVAVEKLKSCVGISNSMCHIRWGRYAECVAGGTRAGGSALRFIYKAPLPAA